MPNGRLSAGANISSARAPGNCDPLGQRAQHELRLPARAELGLDLAAPCPRARRSRPSSASRRPPAAPASPRRCARTRARAARAARRRRGSPSPRQNALRTSHCSSTPRAWRTGRKSASRACAWSARTRARSSSEALSRRLSRIGERPPEPAHHSRGCCSAPRARRRRRRRARARAGSRAGTRSASPARCRSGACRAPRRSASRARACARVAQTSRAAVARAARVRIARRPSAGTRAGSARPLRSPPARRAARETAHACRPRSATHTRRSQRERRPAVVEPCANTQLPYTNAIGALTARPSCRGRPHQQPRAGAERRSPAPAGQRVARRRARATVSARRAPTRRHAGRPALDAPAAALVLDARRARRRARCSAGGASGCPSRPAAARSPRDASARPRPGTARTPASRRVRRQ